MKYFPMSLIAFIALAALPAQAQNFDLLARQEVAFKNVDAERALVKVLDDPRGVFGLYVPQMDRNSRIVSPLKVSGPRQSPRLEMTVKKCVAIVCQTVKMDAIVGIGEVTGSCERNFVIDLDLGRSDQTLTDVYDRLQVGVCFQAKAGGGTLKLTAQARRASSSSSGMVQREIFSLLQAQAAPLSAALTSALQSN